MKSIEERAEEYAWKKWTNPMFAVEWEDCKRDYIRGATDQKAIDIEKAVDWLCDHGMKDVDILEDFLRHIGYYRTSNGGLNMTIEERFDDFARIAALKPDDKSYHIAKACWLQSAHEQKAIDIDKAVEWLRARNVLTDASLQGFKQAMEE